ncbi:DUF2752 domain-containing protein [Edaphobacter albus]|uniref:DUF2752 domain-containing protein n=1 Tax=Edaphobacter sp. 4G125 TaxID=2763071 RepID=UPI001644573F|nr:DUF2752 domain-containing protein [Edaphobacter sp. 4G125]QNI37220.1 DUF2752 domain-containing protein [Edaphobacter sp. 4G125]
MDTAARRINIPAPGVKTSDQDSRSSLLFAAVIISASLIVILLLRFPPEQYAFLYPQCPIHHYLGILCPGCGTTRAIAALLRGHLLEALRFNALTTLSLPVIAGWIIFARKPLQCPRIPQTILYSAFAVAIIFTIARNL